MNMTGMQRRQLQEALLAAFPSEAELRTMVDTRLNENLAVIAGGSTLRDIAFNLITWAVARGQDEKLVKGALAENPGSGPLRTFAEQMGLPVPPLPADDDSSSSTTSSSTSPVTTVPSQKPPPVPTPSNPAPAYLDFNIEITPQSGQDYTVAVRSQGGGDARETMHFPFDPATLEAQLRAVQAAVRTSGVRGGVIADTGAPPAKPITIQEFGQTLFGALFTGEVRSRYDVSRARANAGLRLKLDVQAPELAVVPWEFLYDPRQAEYLCLADTPVVRYLEVPQPIGPLAVAPPLRILGMVAGPSDQAPLDVDQEKARVEKAVERLRGRGLVELVWLPGQTWRDLQDAMRTGPWHIFHFIGHGDFDQASGEGRIALADETGRTSLLSASALARMIAGQRALRLVLLNSCMGAQADSRDIFTATAATLVRRAIPAVLAMQYAISDRAAIEFSRTFYESLADNYPVDAATTEARKAISFALPDTLEWGTPVLYMRTPDGVLLNLVAS